MKALNDFLYRLLRAIITVLMMLLVVPVTLQIASRLIEGIPHYIWTEEAARFCFIWIIMTGATIAVRDGSHFDLDVLPKARSSHGLAAQRLVVHGCMLLMALTFVAFGWQFAQFGYDQESEMTGINMLWIHAAWPFAGIVFTLFLLEKIVDDLKLWRRGSRVAG
jgi:TRAP-type C4-dicarboxylate transport system permease small subunit